jgi:hypothetical protein
MAKIKQMSTEMAALLKSIKADRDRVENKEVELSSITRRRDEKGQKLEDLEKNERYFFDNLYRDPKFGDSADFDVLLYALPDLAIDYKRTVVIYLTFGEFIKDAQFGDMYRLNKNIVSKVVERYLDDLKILKSRYGCRTVQLPKIAGLMTNLIMKYRPVVPKNIEKDAHPCINELFSIHHALCICSDFTKGKELEAFEKSDEYVEFVEDMKYLLNRNFTPECLIMVFKTLCLHWFKSFSIKGVDG